MGLIDRKRRGGWMVVVVGRWGGREAPSALTLTPVSSGRADGAHMCHRSL